MNDLRKAAQELLKALEDECIRRDDWVALALRKALEQPEPEVSYTDIQMAELIMSDCGHSSDYTPLLNRIAGRLATYRQQLAQPEQEPVWCGCGDGIVANDGAKCGVCVMQLENQIERLKSQPEQEPVARVRLLQFLTDVVTAAGLLAHGKRDKGLSERISKESFEMRRIAAPPPSKPWVSLSAKKIDAAVEAWFKNPDDAFRPRMRAAIEAALRSKNNG